MGNRDGWPKSGDSGRRRRGASGGGDRGVKANLQRGLVGVEMVGGG